MQYSKEVEEMICVAKGPNHGPAPIPEEGKWIQAKRIEDISGYTHGVGWCAPQQGACKLSLNVKNGVIEEALVETIGCSGMTHSAAMASEILPGKTILEALNTDLVCDAINTAMRELFLQIVYGRTQSAFSDDGLRVGAGLEDLGKGLRSMVGTMYGTKAKGTRYLEMTEGYVLKMALDKGALNACTLFLKSEYKDITLTGEQRSMISQPRNSQKALRAIWLYAEKSLGVGADKEENRIRLQAAGYILRDDVVRHTVSGETATLDFSSSDMNTISVTEKLNTHKHGRDYHQKIGKIGLEIGMEYSFMNTIIRKLFDKNFNYAHKILALEPREVYAFVLNNADRLRHLVREAMAAEMAQMQLDVQTKSLFEFHIPQSCLFTYNGEAKTQIIYKKNVYQNYLSSAAPRSTPEVKFEKFCEHSGNVEWWYKNGDKGSEYFSIVYGDNSEKQKLFYPDYIVGISGEIWIIETKGGFDRSGNSQDIDIYTPKKFEALKAYLDAHRLKGGIVRNDATTDELCICMEHYSDDIGSDDWVLLENILG